MKSTLLTYTKRLGQEWPRLVVALVSLYGIYYAANVIYSTSSRIQALGLFDTLSKDQSSYALPVLSPEPSQVRLTGDNRITNGKGNDYRGSADSLENGNEFPYLAVKPGLDQILLANGPQVDVDGHSEAAVIYTLLVLSSLSIIDNTIGLIVATRKSLRLTQVAFAIWCLRFLFRILSLITVLVMLAVGADFQQAHLPLGVDFSTSASSNTNSYSSITSGNTIGSGFEKPTSTQDGGITDMELVL
ncbi:hypothetical protein BGX31_000631 [Mortierella sp. GBA43]|nr:hypothetical protein BGX31_000631 [Mortierella sp. GBA43]